MAAVLNPTLPYEKCLTSSCHTGFLLHVEGCIPDDANRFSVNLLTAGGETALHFNPRFDQNLIVLNTKEGGQWKQEQRVALASLDRGQHFELKILVDANGFMVAINGQHHCAFDHRIPLETINCIKIVGDVKIKMIYHTSGSAPVPVSRPVVPTTHEIPGGLQPGRKVTILGRCTGNIFSLNLQCGSEPLHNVALHLNPRLSDNCIVFNDNHCGDWGQEERVSAPLQIDEDFLIDITCHDETFEVQVNGETIGHFAHRKLHSRPLHTVDTLHIVGEVQVKQIFFA